jgi:hypothetical protein
MLERFPDIFLDEKVFSPIFASVQTIKNTKQIKKRPLQREAA